MKGTGKVIIGIALIIAAIVSLLGFFALYVNNFRMIGYVFLIFILPIFFSIKGVSLLSSGLQYIKYSKRNSSNTGK